MARSIAAFSLGGFLLSGLTILGLWGPVSGLLRDAHRVETQRLFQAFAAPLSKAVGQNDDLSKIDELRRLQNLPGVSARVIETSRRQAPESALVWEGKNVGILDVRVLKTRWHFWRYRWLERALTESLIGALLGGMGGYFFSRAQRHFRIRAAGILDRQHRRMDRRRHTELGEAESRHNRWLEQAIGWTSKGLLVLDGRQHILMVNPAAIRHFGLKRQVLGSHWLDHAGSSEWAAVLRQSIENPEVRISGPGSNPDTPISVVTRLEPERVLPELTWIIIG